MGENLHQRTVIVGIWRPFGEQVQVSQIKLPSLKECQRSPAHKLSFCLRLTRCCPPVYLYLPQKAEILQISLILQSLQQQTLMLKWRISRFSKSPRSSVKVQDYAAGRNPKAFRTPEIVSEVQGMGNSPLIGEMCRCVPGVARNTSQTVS